MRKNIHPEYRLTVFLDTSCDYKMLTKSTAKSRETIKYEDGKEYPFAKLEISSKSHPFFTHEKGVFSKVSRVEKFRKKYNINNN